MSLKRRNIEKIKIYVFGCILIIGIWFFVTFPRLSIPMGIAYLSTLMSLPLYQKYQLLDKRRKTLYLTFIVVLLFAMIFPIGTLINNVANEITQINDYLPKFELFLKTRFSQLNSFLLQEFKFKLDVDPTPFVLEKLTSLSEKLLIMLPSLVGSFLELLLLLPMFYFFFLTSYQKLRQSLFKLVPNFLFERVFVLAHQFNSKFADYIVAKFLEASIVGVLIILGLSLINFPYAVILGLVAGITNILPYLGPVLGFAPAVLVGLIEGSPASVLGAMTMVFLIANLIDMILVFPLMVSRIVNLHPIIVIMSVVIGSQAGGVLGMILSVPVAAFIKLLLNEIYKELYQ